MLIALSTSTNYLSTEIKTKQVKIKFVTRAPIQKKPMSYLFPLTYNQLLNLSFLPPNQILSDTNPDVTYLPHPQCMREVLQVNGGLRVVKIKTAVLYVESGYGGFMPTYLPLVRRAIMTSVQRHNKYDTEISQGSCLTRFVHPPVEITN